MKKDTYRDCIPIGYNIRVSFDTYLGMVTKEDYAMIYIIPNNKQRNLNMYTI